MGKRFLRLTGNFSHRAVFLSQQCRLGVHLLLELRGNLRVDGCHGEGFVAEEDFDGLDVHAVFKPMGGDGVTKGVGSDFIL